VKTSFKRVNNRELMRRISFWIVVVAFLAAGGVWLLRAQVPVTPAISAPTITPNLITVNTPTEVTATVAIPDPTLNPTTVDLIRVNPDSSSAVVTRMLDDGRGGDQKPGDRMFTGKFSLNELRPGVLRFQVSAAFTGVVPRTTSAIEQLPVLAPHILPVTLPPDPGEAGKATLAGVDSDRDGVRDDVQRYIILNNPSSEKTRAALVQLAKGLQNFSLSGAAGITAASDARYCLYSVVGFDGGRHSRKDLQAEILNTRERTKAFTSASKVLAGSIIGSDNVDGRSKCQFNLAQMEN
jgi:hypothetical protein